MSTSSFNRRKTSFALFEINTLEASDKHLVEISRELGLGLSLQEMKTVQACFKQKKRNPTDVELQTIA